MVELMIALALTGIVSASVYRILMVNQRAYHRQAQRMELNGNLRAVATMLPAELRELSVTDSAGSDIIAMTVVRELGPGCCSTVGSMGAERGCGHEQVEMAAMAYKRRTSS